MYDKQPNTWIDYQFSKTHGFPHFAYLVIRLLRFIFLGGDPLRVWLGLNLLGLILSGFTAILGFWISNFIIMMLIYFVSILVIEQLGLHECADTKDLLFVPAQGNDGYWYKKRSIKLYTNATDGANILFILPEYNFKTVNVSKHIINAPRIDESQLGSIAILDGRQFNQNLKEGKITKYSRDNLGSALKYVDFNEFAIVFFPKKKATGEPLILVGKPYALLDAFEQSMPKSSQFIMKMKSAIHEWENSSEDNFDLSQDEMKRIADEIDWDDW